MATTIQADLQLTINGSQGDYKSYYVTSLSLDEYNYSISHDGGIVYVIPNGSGYAYYLGETAIDSLGGDLSEINISNTTVTPFTSGEIISDTETQENSVSGANGSAILNAWTNDITMKSGDDVKLYMQQTYQNLISTYGVGFFITLSFDWTYDGGDTGTLTLSHENHNGFYLGGELLTDDDYINTDNSGTYGTLTVSFSPFNDWSSDSSYGIRLNAGGNGNFVISNGSATINAPTNAIGQTYTQWLSATLDKALEDNLFPDPLPGEIIVGRDKNAKIAGINLSDYGVVVGHVAKAFAPSISDTLNTVSAKYGVVYEGMSYGQRVFSIPITLLADDEDEYNTRLNSLRQLFITPNTTTETSLIFGDEPDITYYGHFSSLPDFAFLSETVWDASSTIEFTASDPRGFKESQVLSVTENPFTFTPDGNGMTEMVVTITPKSASYRLGYEVLNNTASEGWHGVFAGRNKINVTDYIQQNRPIVYSNRFRTLSAFGGAENPVVTSLSWSLANNGVATDGTVAVTEGSGETVGVSKFSSNETKNWNTVTSRDNMHGPVILTDAITGLTNSDGTASDWQLDTRLKHVKLYGRAVQAIEFYIIDKNSKRQFRGGIKDIRDGAMPRAYMFLGETDSAEKTNVNKGIGLNYITGPAKDKNHKNNDTKEISLTQSEADTGYVHSQVTTIWEINTFSSPSKRFWTKRADRKTTLYSDSRKANLKTTTSTILNKAKSFNTTTSKKYATITKRIPKYVKVSSGKIYRRGQQGNQKIIGYTNINPKTKNKEVGDVLYWKKGQYKRNDDVAGNGYDYYATRDISGYSKKTLASWLKKNTLVTSSRAGKGKWVLVSGTLSKPKKVKQHKVYSSNTPQKTWRKNKTDVIIQTVDKHRSTGREVTSSTHYVYYNGSKPRKNDSTGSKNDFRSDKPGVLHKITKTKPVNEATTIKTVTTYTTTKTTVVDYNNTDAFTDIYARFHLELAKQTNGKLKLIGQIWSVDGDTGNDIEKLGSFSQTISESQRFTPYQVAYFFGKAPIQEDTLNTKTKKVLKTYTNDVLRAGDLEVRKIYSQDDPAFPHVIVDKKQPLVIDSRTENIYSNGKLINNESDSRSNFPQLQGGKPITLSFTPSTSNADIKIEYRPTHL